jgi:hypothetical protein
MRQLVDTMEGHGSYHYSPKRDRILRLLAAFERLSWRNGVNVVRRPSVLLQKHGMQQHYQALTNAGDFRRSPPRDFAYVTFRLLRSVISRSG